MQMHACRHGNASASVLQRCTVAGRDQNMIIYTLVNKQTQQNWGGVCVGGEINKQNFELKTTSHLKHSVSFP